ncbi:hypothetical protein GCM10009853_015450 [Glycomyces scopariae]
MIMRTWTARATPDGTAAYRTYFQDVLLPLLRARPGFEGGYLVAGTERLETLTLWASLDAIRAFAGEDCTAAVVEPEARAVLIDYDRVVEHKVVLVEARG